ncbi:MAG: glycosyltransferase family 39 protein [Endomicrobium sp.]|jgi:hypothetical protein|nr:glycosyltransferase family 39 protein [Endomicrobium sp.]
MREFLNKNKFYIFSFAAVFFLVFIVYFRCQNFDFIYLDDDALILNGIAQSNSLSKAPDFFFKPVFEAVESKFYRPLLNISLLADTLICGGFAGFYHFTNIIIHVCAVFLLMLVLLSLNFSKKVSLTASLIFAAHPALVSSTAWIPGRNDSLLAFFCFLSFIFFIKSARRQNMLYCFASSISFFAAILTKETAAVLPAAFAAYYIFYKTKRSRTNIIIMSVLSSSVLILYFILRTYAMQNSNPVPLNLIADNIFLSFKALFWYAGLFFFTEKIILYPQIDITFAIVLKGVFPLAVLGAAAFFFRKKINFKTVLFASSWFILFLIPTLAMPNNNYYTHRLYLPAAGLIILFLEITKPVYKNQKLKNVFFILAAAAIPVLALASYKQCENYRDRSSFWFNALKENPNSSRVNAGVGRYYSSLGDNDNYEEYSLKALQYASKNDRPRILTQLGSAYMAKKDYVRAQECFNFAIELNPYAEGAYYYLSYIYKNQNSKEQAAEIIAQALKIMPQSKMMQKRMKELNGKTEEEGFSNYSISVK